MSQRKSDRASYGTRTFRLVDEVARQRCIAMLTHAPLDKLRPLQVVVREEKKQRSNPQNALYWSILGDIAEQAWLEGRQYTSDIWHEFVRRNVMDEQVTTADGETRSKWLEMPDGSSTVISTTLLDQKSFAEYIGALEAFAAGLGVQIMTKEYV